MQDSSDAASIATLRNIAEIVSDDPIAEGGVLPADVTRTELQPSASSARAPRPAPFLPELQPRHTAEVKGPA
ncbi:hypothetical protein Pmar_PMAR028206 [Perkinsus marinus ATCC 50983]|uniref:Uncharacterized protein n=1 Tax=Perkinsus marinus (strain ATCC 50983 / TXsc) TaxID=423536 RepID=C5LB90_PERM5|nr:hypothetical protein Pmar_PMAR028206 [Perkinsus marinus ATCC 50983]EER06018.1 hypothetical protein Pmar_PMAR028206 [Perkinsus marinus ATCC 50983]|eukprot:XP_002774202.1 hypothetical protein Pmar_PMAR028206 [Perkinsus marinus ATCC 50983]